MRAAKPSTRSALPLLQPHKAKAYALDSPSSSSASTAASTPSRAWAETAALARARFASEELVVPTIEYASSVYYGVDVFSPTLVDLLTVDRKRVVWSSRAHRKTTATLHRAWVGRGWRLRSLAYWASGVQTLGFALFLAGFVGELLVHHDPPTAVHAVVDAPLLLGAACFVLAHALGYLEAINSCHNLELWLEEYFRGTEPVLHRRYYGSFPTRIDFWAEVLAIAGSLVYVVARAMVLLLDTTGENFGVISVSRDHIAFILGYWVPFFLGSFCLLFSAYLAHVEVVHRWFSWRLQRLEHWVTGLGMLSAIGFFLASTLQFVDPWSVIVAFHSGMLPLGLGCFFGLLSSALSIRELEILHQRHSHPEYGLLKSQHHADYGSV